MCGDLPLALLLLPEAAADRCRPMLPPGVLVPPVAAARWLLDAMVACVCQIASNKHKKQRWIGYELNTNLAATTKIYFCNDISHCDDTTSMAMAHTSSYYIVRVLAGRIDTAARPDAVVMLRRSGI